MEREEAFDEDYLYFYELLLTDEQSDREAALIWSLLELEPGTQILDLACGHGRIANRLAERGAIVAGLDATPLFLERARADARRRGVVVEYVEGDMRAPPWEGRFDVVVSWFTSFGYFDNDGNRGVLDAAYATLRPGGRLLLDLNHLTGLLRVLRPTEVVEREDAFAIDRRRYNVSTGCFETERTIVRGGSVRRFSFAVRAFTFAELRDWLDRAGFVDVRGYGRDGEPLTLEHSRMVVVASKPA